MIERINTETEKHRMTILWRVIAAGGVCLSLLLYFTVPAVHRAVSGWSMALTQRSTQAVAGAILSAGRFAVPKAIVLSAFQTVALPWLLSYSIGGTVLAFGRLFGAAISMAGALIGAGVWFGIVRLFLKDVIQKLWAPRFRLHTPTGFCLTAAANLLAIGMLCIPAAVAGAARVSFRGFLFSAFIAELPIVICFAVCSNAYRALLPNPVEALLRGLGMLLLLAGAAIEAYLRKKDPLIERRRGEEQREN